MNFGRMLQNSIGRCRSTSYFKALQRIQDLQTIASRRRRSHFRTSQGTPFRSGSSKNERVRSHSDPGDLGTVNIKS